MASINKCFFIGNLGRDPEMRYFQDGTPVCNVSIACTETWKDKSSGERKERTEWVPLVFTGPLAEVAGKYLKKGSQVHVEGKFATRKWTDKEGAERYTTEIKVSEMTMLGGRPADGGQAQGGVPSQQRPAQAPASQQRQQRAATPAPQQDYDDDIPF